MTEIAEELNRAADELVGSFDEMRRAAEEIARQQVQVAEVQAAIEKMKLRELPEMTEMRKQIEAIREELQKLRAR